MIQFVLMFLWTSFVKYVSKRCTGDFLDNLFDETLTILAKCTKSSVDDNIVAKWKGEKLKEDEEKKKVEE